EPARGTGAKIVGFQASNQVTIRLHEINRVADIIDRAVSAGANTLSGVEFLVVDAAKALDQLRPLALASARRRAEIYAKAAGAGVGHAVAIDEQGSVPVGGFMRTAGAAAPPTPIVAGEETLRFSVTVTYELLY